MKITVIGGGSTYTPELVSGFLARVDSLPLNELWLMDVDRERLDIVGGFAQRMVKAKGDPFKVVLSLNQREAVWFRMTESAMRELDGKLEAAIKDKLRVFVR